MSDKSTREQHSRVHRESYCLMHQTKNPSQPGNAGSTAVRSLPGDFGSLCSWSCKMCEYRLFWEQCHGQRFSGTAKHSMPQWPRHRTMSGKKDSNVDSRAWELDSYRSYFTSEPEARMSPSKQSVWYPALLRKPRICFQHAETALRVPSDPRTDMHFARQSLAVQGHSIFRIGTCPNAKNRLALECERLPCKMCICSRCGWASKHPNDSLGMFDPEHVLAFVSRDQHRRARPWDLRPHSVRTVRTTCP